MRVEKLDWAPNQYFRGEGVHWNKLVFLVRNISPGNWMIKRIMTKIKRREDQKGIYGKTEDIFPKKMSCLEDENDIRGFTRGENSKAACFELKNATLVAHSNLMGRVCGKARCKI